MGSVVLSVDAELGWGFHDLDTPPPSRVEFARYGWQRLYELCETYDVPATWAVVGHLLLSECDRVHEDHPAPPGWFDRESTAWRLRPDLRFGPELVSALQESTVDHDIGCHGFSHVIFDDERVTEDVVRAELRAAKGAGESMGIEYDSFVFPRNAVGYRDVLAEFGYATYRSGENRPERAVQFEKVARTIDPDRVPLVEPVVDEYGLVDIPPSLFLFSFQGPVRRVCEAVWTDPVVRQATGAINRAVSQDGLVHLWLHPNNLNSQRNVARMERILAHIDSRRSDGLVVETMVDVATRYR